MSESELRPSEGWGVIHLFLRADGGGDGRPILAALEEFAATDPNQVIAFSVLGGRADMGLMLLSPDLDALDRVVTAVTAAAVFRRPSKVLEDQVRAGRVGALQLAGGVALQGGIPIMVNGQTVGAIGVSGKTPAEDEAIAVAGANAVQ